MTMSMSRSNDQR